MSFEDKISNCIITYEDDYDSYLKQEEQFKKAMEDEGYDPLPKYIFWKFIISHFRTQLILRFNFFHPLAGKNDE